MTEQNTKYVILTALQFDETGDLALSQAVRIAELHPQAELHVVHVVPPSIAADLRGDANLAQARWAQAPEQLKKQVDRICGESQLRVRGHVRSGDPAQLILHTAAEVDADVIVVGTHRRRGLEKLVLGSVAEHVLHSASCPVFIALPKVHERSQAAESVEPPCPDCVTTRRATGNAGAWCERHSRPGLRVHVYTPSDQPRATFSGT